MKLFPISLLSFALLLLPGFVHAQEAIDDENEQQDPPLDEEPQGEEEDKEAVQDEPALEELPPQEVLDDVATDKEPANEAPVAEATFEVDPPKEEKESEWDRWVGDKFMDTRVTFVFADDNLLANEKDRSPSAGFQSVDDEIFFENLQTEKRGLETETQLVLYKRMPSYFRRLDAEAALVIELQHWVNEQTWKNETKLSDDGSYLKLNFYTRADDFDGDHISLTFFPMDSQRFLLGYTYDITWGGERIFPNNSGQVPGARLRYDIGVGTDHQSYVFIGAKTARLLNEAINERQTYYGALGGFGIGLTSFLDFEMNGGYFQRGAFPPESDAAIGGKTATAFGGSARLTAHMGMPIANSVDFRLYKYSPDAPTLMAEEQKYADGISWRASGEFTTVAQSLRSWDDADSTELVPSKAAALNARFRWNKLRVHGDFIYRDLSYVVFNIPGIAPYRNFPDDAEINNEWFIAGGVDYYFPIPRLTPGVIFGYKQPATYKSKDSVTRVVIRDEYDWETLPANQQAFDIFAAKLTLKWDVAKFFVVMGELRYTLDKNRAKYVKSDDSSGRLRVFEDDKVTNRLGFSLMAQAKW